MKYNIMVYILMMAIISIIVFGSIVLLLMTIVKYKNTLINKYPKTLGVFSSSRSIKIMILLNQVGLLYIFLAMVNIVHFLYDNSIPVNLGDICDASVKK